MKRILVACVPTLLSFLSAFAQYEGRGRMSDVKGSSASDGLMIVVAFIVLVVAGIFCLYMKFSSHSSEENKKPKESNDRIKKRNVETDYYNSNQYWNDLKERSKRADKEARAGCWGFVTMGAFFLIVALSSASSATDVIEILFFAAAIVGIVYYVRHKN